MVVCHITEHLRTVCSPGDLLLVPRAVGVEVGPLQPGVRRADLDADVAEAPDSDHVLLKLLFNHASRMKTVPMLAVAGERLHDRSFVVVQQNCFGPSAGDDRFVLDLKSCGHPATLTLAGHLDIDAVTSGLCSLESSGPT
eukprot:15435716-Alexandrium_andersonii.AAC.1